MKNISHYFSFFIACLINCAVFSQVSMLTEFKALPAFPANARAAFSASDKEQTQDLRYMYKGNSAAIQNYTTRLQNDNKPYQEIILAKGQQGMTPGKNAANDFSDLASPETQAKLAKMSKEEQMKFAMEVQARMSSNTNLQAVQTINRPSPLLPLVLKLNRACDTLFSTLKPYPSSLPIDHKACDINCGEPADKACIDKVEACNHKVSRDYYNAEIARYDAFIKAISLKFEAKRKAFEDDLKEFDSQASKYPANDIAVDCSNVIVMLMRYAGMLGEYEKQGAAVIIDAKNNHYCGKEF